MKKLRDLWERFGGVISSIFKIVMTLGAVIVLGGLMFGWFEEKPDVEEVDKLKDIRGNIEVLYRYVDEVSETPTVSYDLLVKDPFMSAEDMELLLLDMVEKDKEVVKEETGNKYWGSEFNIYTRQVVYDLSLNPPYTATYGHKDGYEETTLKRLSNYRNHELESYYSPMYPETDDEGNEKKVMLSDKDYELFLRINELREVTGQDFGSGLTAYLEYDLGIEVESEKYFEMFTKYEEFYDRALNANEPSNMYDGMRDYMYEVYQEEDKKFYDYLYERYGDPNELY